MEPNRQLREFLRAMLDMKLRIMEIPTGYNYHGAEDYILDRGHQFESKRLTDKERLQLFAAVDNWGRRFQLGQCFYNAQMLLFYDQAEVLRYYEGFAAGPAGMPVLHAWLSIGSHKVVDLTWRRQRYKRTGRLPNRVIGAIPKGWAYYGVEIPRRTIIERILDTEMSQSHLEDWKQGFPLFRQERIRPVKELLHRV